MDVIVVGAGGMGSVHARNWARYEDVNLKIYDRDLSKSQKLASETNGSAVEDFKGSLQASSILDICTPTPFHLEYLLEGLRENKIIACEKPLVRSEAEIEALSEAVKSSHGQVIPCHVVRNFPPYLAAHRAIKDGKIGTPAAITMHRGGRTPSGSQEWFLDHCLSGGVLLDLAIHDFDWLIWTLGPAAEVTSRSISSKTGTGPDYALTTIKFESGAVATVESSWLDLQGFHTWFDISGSEGLLQHDSKKEASVILGKGTGMIYESSLCQPDDPYTKQTDSIYRVAKFKEAPAVQFEEGIQAVRLSLASIESAKNLSTVSLTRT